MFESTYVDGEVIATFDSKISAAIGNYGLQGGGSGMRIAIENTNSRVYRVITALGLGAYMHMVDSLSKIGLKDILAGSINGKDGYDSWFVVTPEVIEGLASEQERITHAGLLYTVGDTYTRQVIYALLGIPEDKRRGDWLNGYHRHGSDYYIFCNVGGAGRTGRDHRNKWDGEKLIWHGKAESHFDQQTIKNLISGEFRVLIFYRSDDRSPFIFAGVGCPVPYLSIERPVRIDWVFGADDAKGAPVFTDEYVLGSNFVEGQRIQVFVNRYERDRRARDACIEYHGTTCAVCGFDFQEKYGELGKGFIHVHHVTPISEIGQDYVVDPIEHLFPVCPNCHSMLHRKNPPLSIEELKRLM